MTLPDNKKTPMYEKANIRFSRLWFQIVCIYHIRDTHTPQREGGTEGKMQSGERKETN